MKFVNPPPGVARRASSVWMAAAILCFVGAAALGLSAGIYQVSATRPTGEGELFAQEAAQAASMMTAAERAGAPARDSLRHIRNRLGIEAVGLVDADGIYAADTSGSFVGRPLQPALLAGFHRAGRFGALIAPLTVPVRVDGVVEWQAGDSLYQVIEPVGNGESLVLSYDVSTLLARRTAQQGVRSLTLVLAGGAVVVMVGAILLLVARAGARRRIAEAFKEAELMEARSLELQEHNRELDEARREAERALALAEETNRIRSEFVLMINHELRTPLTSMVTGAQLLIEDGLDRESRHQVITDMVRDGRRLHELISQMLAVARIENRGLGYALRDVSLGEVMSRIESLGGGRLSLEGESGPDDLDRPDMMLHTDPDPLAHLLLSLADNAMTHGAATVRLEVTDRVPSESVTAVGDLPEEAVYFLVVDDGPGIDPAFLPRAFEKFEKQGRNSGTGLGLYLARLMVEAIEGSIAPRGGPGMKPSRPVWGAVLLALSLAFLVSGCSRGAVSKDRVSLREYSIQTGSQHWSAGKVELEVDNEGEFSHTLVVTAEDGTVVSASDVLPPGEETTVDLDLPPGKYQLTCRIVVQTDRGLVDHYQEGMHTTVQVDS